MIYRNDAIDAMWKLRRQQQMLDDTHTADLVMQGIYLAEKALEQLPSAQSETCEGCKHLGKWEDELEYGYLSPCTRCKRMVGDHYER